MTKARLGVNRVSGHTSVGFPERLVKQTKLVKTVQGCERTRFIYVSTYAFHKENGVPRSENMAT